MQESFKTSTILLQFFVLQCLSTLGLRIASLPRLAGRLRQWLHVPDMVILCTNLMCTSFCLWNEFLLTYQ